MKTYFGLNITNAVFNGYWTVKIVRKVLSVEEAKAKMIGGISLLFCPGCNKRIIDMMREVYGVEFCVVEDLSGKNVSLGADDSFLVLDVGRMEWAAEKMKRQEPAETSMAFIEYRVEPEQAVKHNFAVRMMDGHVYHVEATDTQVAKTLAIGEAMEGTGSTDVHSVMRA